MNPVNVWIVAKNTFRSTITGRWLIIFAIVFFLLILNIPLLYILTNQEAGPSYLNQYAGYLISLAFPFLPLLALPVGAPAVAEERESGVLQFTLSAPISKGEYLIGKLAGLFFATTIVILGAFGMASVTAYGTQFARYANVGEIILVASLLNGTMVGLALTISILSKRRATAVGLGLFFWFLLTSISNLGILSSILSLKLGPWMAMPLVLLNPVEVAEILAGAFTGMRLEDLSVTSQLLKFTLGENVPIILATTAVAWAAALFALAYLLFRRQDV